MNIRDEHYKQELELLEKKIIDLLSADNVIPLFEEQLIDQLKLTPEQEGMIHEILNNMVKEGKLVQTKKKKYAIPEGLGFFTGRLQGNARGFGFFIPDKEEDDVFISAENLNGAMHNDRILIRLLRGNGRSKEGEVVRILERLIKHW